MQESTKQGVFQAFSFTAVCVIMCGAAVGLLISSGWLVFLADEGQRKIFLLPLLTILCVFYFIYKKQAALYFLNQILCKIILLGLL